MPPANASACLPGCSLLQHRGRSVSQRGSWARARCSGDVLFREGSLHPCHPRVSEVCLGLRIFKRAKQQNKTRRKSYCSRPLFSMRPEASGISSGSTASRVSSNLPPSSLMGRLLPRSEATGVGTTLKVPGMHRRKKADHRYKA